MTIIFYLLPLFFVVPAGIYFYFFFRRFLTLLGMEKKTKKNRIMALLLAVMVAALGVRMVDFSFIIMLHLLLACLGMEIVNLVLKRIHQQKLQRIWAFLYKSGILSLAIAVTVLSYGYFNMRNVQRTEYNVDTAKPIEEDMKIVDISDLHSGTTFDEEEMAKAFANVQREEADLLVLTGDIFDETTTLEQMKKTVDMLSEIEATYGTYYIFGNHDVNQYTSSPAYTAAELKKALSNAGIKVMEDDVLVIADGITLIGRRDVSADERKTIEALVSQADRDDYLLLLDHQPVDLEAKAQAGVDLVLSGHTHGGQIWPMGILSKITGVNEEYYGLHKSENFRVIVSSGMAGWAYPIRTEGRSEYVVINLRQLD